MIKTSERIDHPRRRRRASRRAFTLMELLLVLAILVIIGALVLPNIFGTKADAERQATQAQIANLDTALNMYKFHLGAFPGSDEGLEALFTRPATDEGNRWKGPYLDEKTLQDPWGRPYQYQYPPQNHAEKPDIWSVGPDGQEGTEDDVMNWVIQGTTR